MNVISLSLLASTHHYNPTQNLISLQRSLLASIHPDYHTGHIISLSYISCALTYRDTWNSMAPPSFVTFQQLNLLNFEEYTTYLFTYLALTYSFNKHHKLARPSIP